MNATVIANERAGLLGLSFSGGSTSSGQVYLALLMIKSNQTAIEIVVDNRCQT